ncbi:MAG: methionine synthase [Lachnospiraceae bacterium]|nr:methionine synthase [Lachnospiraceae bacterium]
MNAYKVKLNSLDGRDALRYLGLKEGLADPAMASLFEKCKARLLAVIDARYVYRVFPFAGGLLEGSAYQPRGGTIARHLAGAERVILLAATLGSGTDLLIRRSRFLGMTETMMVDALASEAIERVLDAAEAGIFSRLGPDPHTFRYSPGYGDLPLEGQKELLEVLDARKRIGLYVNESMLMTPSKSVTCLIGTGGNLRGEAKKTCRDCSLDGKCSFRQNGGTCYR